MESSLGAALVVINPDAEEINFHVEQIVLDVEEILTHAE